MFCENCNAHLEEDALFCPECGTKVVNKVQEVHSQAGEAQAPVQPQVVPVQPQVVSVQPQPIPVPVQPQAVPVTPQPMVQPQATSMMGNQMVDERNKPMSVGQYILTFIIMGLPIIGFVMTLVWAFSSTVNRNKKNFAIAVIVMAIIATALAVVSTILLGAVFAELFDDLYYYL